VVDLVFLTFLAVVMVNFVPFSFSLSSVPSTPLINLLELSPPKALASSTASLMTTFGGGELCPILPHAPSAPSASAI
jgi:hypothetical protein